MSFALNAIDRIIFKTFNLSDESLGIYRISYSLFILIAGVPTFSWIHNFPAAFYNPPLVSLGALFSKFPPYWFLLFLSLSICLLTILLLFGYKTRAVSILLGVSILVGKSFSYSFGKINHDIFLWLIPLIMAFSNWGRTFSIDSKKNNLNRNFYGNSWPVTLLALILCLAMFSAGLPKILSGWLQFSSQAVRGHFLSSYYQNGRHSFLAHFFLNLNSAFVWEFFDYAAVIFELTFLFALIRPNVFRSFIFCAIIFHVLNLLILNIPFSSNCILYLVFIDWNMVIGFFKKHKILTYLSRLINIKNMVIVSAAYLIFFLLFLKQNTNRSSFSVSPLQSLLEDLNVDSYLIIGSSVLFLSLSLSITNIVYFLSTKKTSGKVILTNTQ